MSRIEELETCLRLANERAATLSAANDKLSRQLEAECGTEQKLHDKIRHLTAELTAKDAEIERLREASEKVVEQYNVIEFDVDMSNWIEAVVLYDKAMLALKLALAATAGGEGE